MTTSELKSLLEKRAEKLAEKYYSTHYAGWDNGNRSLYRDQALSNFKAGHASTHELICELVEFIENYDSLAFPRAAKSELLDKLRADLETK